jgi:hypothetical protein
MPRPMTLSPASIRNVVQNRPHPGRSVRLPCQAIWAPRRKTFSWFVVPPAALNRERNVNSPPANRARTSTRSDAGKLPTSSGGPDPMRVFVLFPSLPSAYSCRLQKVFRPPHVQARDPVQRTRAATKSPNFGTLLALGASMVLPQQSPTRSAALSWYRQPGPAAWEPDRRDRQPQLPTTRLQAPSTDRLPRCVPNA